MVMNETSKRIRDKMIPDVKKEIREEICDYLPDILPEIMQDIVYSMTLRGYVYRDFREELNHLPPEIVECAIQTATAAVHVMEARYLYRILTTPGAYEDRYGSSVSESENDNNEDT